MAFLRTASLLRRSLLRRLAQGFMSQLEARGPGEILARGSRGPARNRIKACRIYVSGDSSRATKKKGSRYFPVCLTGAAAGGDRPDLDQRVALHDVIGL